MAIWANGAAAPVISLTTKVALLTEPVTYTTIGSLTSSGIVPYLESGTIAMRPSEPNIAANTIALYFATDTAELSLWTGTEWREDIISDGGSDSGYVSGPASSVDNSIALFDGITGKFIKQSGRTYNEARTHSIIVACSDETTNLTAGTAKVTFRMPYAFTLTSVRASLTASQPSGSILTVDVNESGASILSTKLTIDNTETTSTAAASTAVISKKLLAEDAEITVDIDQVGTPGAKGLKVALIGYTS